MSGNTFTKRKSQLSISTSPRSGRCTFAAMRLLPIEQDFVARIGERPAMVKSRLRSLGCSPCTGAIRSDAVTIPEIIAELISFRSSERANRVIDHDQEGSMELKKREGYF